MLCNLCQNIHFKRYLELTREDKIDLLTYYDEWPPEADDEDEILISDQWLDVLQNKSFYFHHRNLESLRKAADDGCSFCYRIFYGLLETTELDHDVENSSERLYLNLLTPFISGPEREHLYRGHLDVRIGTKFLGNMRLKDLENFAKFAPSIRDMECNSSTGSSTNLDLAAGWLHDCANYHKFCSHQPQVESILPYRVLDVGSLETPQIIFLSIGEGRSGSYAALSYCWGKPDRQSEYLTTNENLKQRQEAMDILSLPKTFTDAIVVCRHLGIRFLWIDSLCIIQYDANDWQKQSGQMGEIYSNATLTISAAVGEDSHSGLFVDRDPWKIHPCTLNLQYPNEDGVVTNGTFLTCLDSYGPMAAYLDTRGWTFQEKYLSPRILTFSKTEMCWTCASFIASERLPMGLHPLNNKSDFDKYIKVDKNGAVSAQVNTVQRYHWWYQSMEIYSHRIFTHESDRLVALAGLAWKFQRPGDEFLYGLWKSDLAHGLAWRIGGNRKEIATDLRLTTPIPSWSWASRPGNIITYFKSDSWPGLVMDTNESITSYHIPEGSLQHTFIEDLSVEPIPPATNSVAFPTNRSLMLRGLVLRVSPTKSSPVYDGSSWSTGSFMVFQSASSSTNQPCKQFLGDVFYDEPVTKGENLYCLPLTVLPLKCKGNLRRPNDVNTQTYQPFENIDIDKLVSIQNMSLEIGEGALPGMTWCAGLISSCRLKKKDGLRCLLLKRVDAEEMKFRRVGYLEGRDGRIFAGLAPVTLEIT